VPSLTVDDPTTGEEVLADDVNNRRAQIETVVNSLDDTNLAADFPTVTGTTIAGLSPDEGRLGLIRLGSTPFQIAQLTNRDHVQSGVVKPDLFISDWKPLIFQHEVLTYHVADNSRDWSVSAGFPVTTMPNGFIPNAKAYFDAGFHLLLHAGGLMTVSANLGINSSLLEFRLNFQNVDSGDTALTSIATTTIQALNYSGGLGTSFYWIGFSKHAPAMTKAHLVVTPRSYHEIHMTVDPSVRDVFWDRHSVHYAWITAFS